MQQQQQNLFGYGLFYHSDGRYQYEEVNQPKITAFFQRINSDDYAKQIQNEAKKIVIQPKEKKRGPGRPKKSKNLIKAEVLIFLLLM